MFHLSNIILIPSCGWVVRGCTISVKYMVKHVYSSDSSGSEQMLIGNDMYKINVSFFLFFFFSVYIFYFFFSSYVYLGAQEVSGRGNTDDLAWFAFPSTGNPLAQEILSLYQEPDGTRRLLSYLLDNLAGAIKRSECSLSCFCEKFQHMLSFLLKR